MEVNNMPTGPTKNSANYQSENTENELQKRKKLLKRAIWGISALIICLLIVLIIPNAAQIQCLFSGHQWKTATCTAPKTCSVCGETEGETLPHKWIAATCTKAKHCSVCGKEEGNLKAHTWVDATCTEAKHCSVCNKKEGTAKGHTWVAATCTTRKHCSVCKKVEGSLAAHDWKEATYTSPKTCRACGKTEGNVKGYIDKLSYHWGDVRIELAGTHWNAIIPDKTIKNCYQMTLRFKISSISYGSPYGRWLLYGKDLTGQWQKLHYFDVPGQETVTEIIAFEPSVSFSELFLACVGPSRGWSANVDFEFTDIYTREDQ